MRSRRLRSSQRDDDVGQAGEVDAVPGVHRLDAERDGKMALAGAARLEQEHDWLC